MKTKRALRQCFLIVPRAAFGYDVFCAVEGCNWDATAWDYRRNALSAGYAHAREAHND